jgi:hypothetical protein
MEGKRGDKGEKEGEREGRREVEGEFLLADGPT